MRNHSALAVSLSVIMTLAGCAETPMGPRVQVLPAANKPFEVFQQDLATCKRYAADQVGPEAEHTNMMAIGTTLLGAGLGAGLGAAIGGGRGAAIGAAGGGIAGTAVGASNSQRDHMSTQKQYDNAYVQCMYAKGNQVGPPPAVIQPMVIYPAPPSVVYVPAPPAVYYSPPPVVYAPPPGATVAPPPPPPPPPGIYGQ